MKPSSIGAATAACCWLLCRHRCRRRPATGTTVARATLATRTAAISATASSPSTATPFWCCRRIFAKGDIAGLGKGEHLRLRGRRGSDWISTTPSFEAATVLHPHRLSRPENRADREIEENDFTGQRDISAPARPTPAASGSPTVTSGPAGSSNCPRPTSRWTVSRPASPRRRIYFHVSSREPVPFARNVMTSADQRFGRKHRLDYETAGAGASMTPTARSASNVTV